MKQILNKAKKIVIPPKKLENDISKVAKFTFDLVRKEVSKFPEIMEVEFGGSYAKGTWFTDKADVDIFIKFNKSTSEKKFTEIAKKIGFNSLKKYNPYVRYSDHPYVEAKIQRTKVNVVPCYQVQKGKWQSAADRSPFHTKFMLESLTGQMKDDIRLLKSFLKSNRIYGAEIARQGFSGYVAEVLVWNYGSFESVVKSIARIEPNKVIGKSSKKFETSIVIMDPIDSNRNLAAAISAENVGKFVLLCRAFLKKPSIEFFKLKTNYLPKNNLKNVLTIKFNYKPRSPDIVWGQAKRAANALAIQLELEGFKVLRNAATTDERNEINLIFLLQSLRISEDRIKGGPDFFSRLDSDRFITMNIKDTKIMWVGSNRKILSLEKRKYNDAKKFLNDLLKKNLNKSGIPKGLKGDIKKGFCVLPANKAVTKSIKEAISEFVSTDGAIFPSY